MTGKSCRHGTLTNWRCDLCDSFVCSLRKPPQGLDFPELLIPPYLTARTMRPPPLLPMPQESGLPIETLHKMGAWSRDYSYLRTTANRNNGGITPSRTPNRRLGVLRRDFEDRLKILSPLAKMRIVPRDETKEAAAEKSKPSEAPSPVVKQLNIQNPESHADRQDHESDDSDYEDEDDANPEHGQGENNVNQALQEYQMRVEKRRRQEEELHRLQEEKLRRQQEEQEKQEIAAREQAERERRRLLIEQRRQSNARRRLQTQITNQQTPTGKILGKTPRMSLRRIIHTPNSRIPLSTASARTANRRVSTRRVSLRIQPRTPRTQAILNRQNPQNTATKPRKSRNPPLRSVAAQQGIAAARARCLAASSALVQQRKSEREATLKRIEQERQARQQAAREKVEAERRRTAASRQRQQEAFQSIQRRVKLTDQQSPSKVTPRFLQPPKPPARIPRPDPITHTAYPATSRIPRKLWDWQTRRAHKIESIRDLFSLTHLGQSPSRTFTPLALPKHIQINNQFHTLEKEIYLPAVPPVAKDDLLSWKLNSADIDVALRVFRLEDLPSSLEASITQPWADRAVRVVRRLPDHLYYVWRICHNYGYFGWKVPAATPRAFAQARRFGELDREWDEVIAAREVNVQTQLENLGLEERIPLVRIASGYQ
ncbi:hypothetical protein TWF696_000201 [Orbilia brochopaga]|uniref:Uncharacterized protein n=1 Tax=Orbilia brochopaga TaxID=3140254 RepID=A0AAV9VAP8_9PEZI